MARNGSMRALRGALGNAIIWGAGFGAIGFAVIALLQLVNVLPGRLIDALGMAIRIGIMGGIASFAFAGVIRLLYRRKRVSDISVARFALIGAIVTGLFVPLFMQLTNILSGSDLAPWRDIDSDVIGAFLVGGAIAAASLHIAQRASASAEADDVAPLDDGSGLDLLNPGSDATAEIRQRARQTAD